MSVLTNPNVDVSIRIDWTTAPVGIAEGMPDTTSFSVPFGAFISMNGFTLNDKEEMKAYILEQFEPTQAITDAATQKVSELDSALTAAYAAADSANTASDLAATAASNANAASAATQQAITDAVQATQAASAATTDSIQRTAESVSATHDSVVATVNADTATASANAATASANTAASNANLATTNTQAATASANTATDRANSISATLEGKLPVINTAISDANTATQNAVVATTNANNAAAFANTQRGWSPTLQAVVISSTLTVLKCTGYVGGTGTAPTTNVGMYLSSSGFTSDSAQALNVKGNTGTLAIGSVVSGPTASVTNVGTSTSATLNFVLPKGDTGNSFTPKGSVTTQSALPAGAALGDAYIIKDTNSIAMYGSSGWVISVLTFENPTNVVDSINGNNGAITLDKTWVGLDKVDNTADLNKPVSNATQAALNLKADAATAVTTNMLGQANGVATLDAAGLVKSQQLPSYVDDVLEYTSVAAFPTTGESGKIYVETTGNTTYRWSGTTYVKITSGEVSSVNGRAGVITLTKSDVGLGNVDNTADASKTVAAANKLATARTINGVPFDGTTNITTMAYESVYATDKRFMNPADTPKHGIAFYFTSKNGLDTGTTSDTTYGDFISLNSYSDVSGGANNGLFFNKRNQGIYHYFATWGGTSGWGTPKQLAYTDSNITGNAASAAKLQTARLIGGVSFDGTADITLTKTSVGLGNVDNTSDANKPISTATQSALNLKANSADVTNQVNTLNTAISQKLDSTATATAAAKLATARNINGVAFDGSQDITIADGTKLPYSGGTLTGALNFANSTWNTVGDDTQIGDVDLSGILGIRSNNTTAHVGIGFYMMGADKTAPSALLKVLASGEADLNVPLNCYQLKGNATSASKLATARNINGIAFDGTGDITVADATKLPLTGGTLTGKVTGKTSGTDATGSFAATTTGGSFASMWARRGAPFYSYANQSGSSYAPALVCEYNNNAGYNGVYSLGTLDNDATDPGAFVIAHINSSGTYVYNWLFSGVNGDFTSPGNITAYSDSRLKTDIVKIPDALSKVEGLNGYTYTRIDSGEKQTGLIAQELEEVLPEAVVQGETYKSVAYGNVVGLLVEAIKELSDKVKAQDKLIASLMERE